MEAQQLELLGKLFAEWAGKEAEKIEPLPRSGSDRVYARLTAGSTQAIGAYNPDHAENRAFIAFSKHFHQLGLPVPEVFATQPEAGIYLQQDLGNQTLLQTLQQERAATGEAFPAAVRALYQESLQQLAHLQVKGAQGLDFSLSYPRTDFDQTAMLWDLNYFKYFFLKLSGVAFHEQALENDFQALTDYLQAAERSYFLFRDFQSRNIMVHDGRPHFIDYQGGRRGALQYDVASLLYQARAAIPHADRMDLLEHYLDALGTIHPVDRDAFKTHFFGFVLIRVLQTLGAYGFRGFYERRPHFLASVPYALKNLDWIRENVQLPIELPELYRLLDAIPKSPQLAALQKTWDAPQTLTVRVASFSYRSGIPEDPSGNGGGFVFDCRSIHNPGRYPPYKKQTGRDQPVIDFLRANSRIETFLQDVYATVDPAVERYLDRGFTHLMVSFGCTGGQHRSVFSADQTARHLQEKYGVNVVLNHFEQEKKNWIN